MLPDRVSNPGPLTYEPGALPIALRGPARQSDNRKQCMEEIAVRFLSKFFKMFVFFHEIMWIKCTIDCNWKIDIK